MNQRADAIQTEVAEALATRPRHLSPRFFYDALGSKLFEAITYTATYYPTRCEVEILTAHGEEIAEAMGPGVLLLELGSGMSTKVPLLLARMRDVRAYVPVDIDAETLEAAAAQLRRQFEGLEVLPLAADFTRPWELPPMPDDARTIAFFPGSTIGNLDAAHAQDFLASLGGRLKPGDGLLIGYDLEKDVAVLERAYDDPAGVTAAFNRNMLTHLNCMVGTDFDASRWSHVAFYNAALHRMEMHLRSEGAQEVRLGADVFAFEDGETIHTESSYKYRRQRFAEMASSAGWREERFWTDDQGWFGVALYRWDP